MDASSVITIHRLHHHFNYYPLFYHPVAGYSSARKDIILNSLQNVRYYLSILAANILI